ncbi:FecR domain-containing protein [Stenotrophomonas sp. BIGb0135]|uniref:FecR family protein n=1 Tax=Stenotrophomonas sp. BIGb0135 TaxID=2940620 RepID=UPI002168F25A|nr:FecR domain-containing protein [Stenotrophomonas sp. BIGb0135]MCS4233728.1 transmembrane sensor [Stenotrophomonas sp. BIGb0135]
MQGGAENRIDDEAARWVAREDRGPLPPEELAERDRWLASDRRHFGAYARAHAVYARTGRARALGSADRVPAARPVAGSRPRLQWAMGLAASLCLLVLGVHPHTDAGDYYVAAKGEIRRVPLADGSAVTLDSGAAVRVHYTDKRRELSLLRGEALFDVAKNRARPFVVVARDTAVTAVGTSFSVSLNEQRTRGVEVLVREGIVDVANASGAIAPTRLLANHRALANRTHGIRIESVGHDDLDQQLAWREGMLSFNGDTLSVAAAQFLRYSDVRIMIDDPLVGSRRIVGLYSANDPIGFARSVALSLGLDVEQNGNDVWLRTPHNASYSAPRSLQ